MKIPCIMDDGHVISIGCWENEGIMSLNIPREGAMMKQSRGRYLEGRHVCHVSVSVCVPGRIPSTSSQMTTRILCSLSKEIMLSDTPDLVWL